MVPIIGLDNSDLSSTSEEQNWKPSLLGGEGSFTSTQPDQLVKAIAEELKITDRKPVHACTNILLLHGTNSAPQTAA